MMSGEDQRLIQEVIARLRSGYEVPPHIMANAPETLLRGVLDAQSQAGHARWDAAHPRRR